MSTLRGPAQLADLQGALCVPTYNLTNGVVKQTQRAECRPSRFRGRRDRANIQLSCPSMIHLTLGLTTHRTAGHKKSIIMQKFSPLLPRLRQMTLPFEAASFTDALRENLGALPQLPRRQPFLQAL